MLWLSVQEQIKSALSICPAAHGPLHEGVVVSFC